MTIARFTGCAHGLPSAVVHPLAASVADAIDQLTRDVMTAREQLLAHALWLTRADQRHRLVQVYDDREIDGELDWGPADVVLSAGRRSGCRSRG